jgi:hypothetical protein
VISSYKTLRDLTLVRFFYSKVILKFKTVTHCDITISFLISQNLNKKKLHHPKTSSSLFEISKVQNYLSLLIRVSYVKALFVCLFVTLIKNTHKNADHYLILSFSKLFDEKIRNCVLLSNFIFR